MYPYIIIFGRAIGSYGLCMALAMLLVSALAIRYAKRLSVPAEDVIIIGAVAVGFALLGGSLLYIFVTYPISYILEALRNGDLSFLTSGGIVFYGGLLGGLAGAFVGARIAKRKLVSLEDAIVPYIPLGHAIGRIGCTLAGCCHGAPYEGLFAIHYHNSITGLPPEQGYFPVQPLEAILNTVICLLLLLYRKRTRRPYALLFAYLGMYALVRFTLEFFRGDSIRGLFGAISTSQWISLGLFAACAVYLLISRRAKKQ